MKTLLVLVMLICLSPTMATSYRKKISPQPGLKYFRSDYNHIRRTCKSLGFKHKNCVIGNRIAFTAISTSTKSYSPSKTIEFPKVKLNQGNGYNNHNHHFTAPRNGHYFISWSIAIYTSSYHGFTRLMKDGTEFARTNCRGAYQQCGSTVTIYLTKGNNIWLQPAPSSSYTFYSHGGYSVFTGYRLT